jgi:hypothetical protein
MTWTPKQYLSGPLICTLDTLICFLLFLSALPPLNAFTNLQLLYYLSSLPWLSVPSPPPRMYYILYGSDMSLFLLLEYVCCLQYNVAKFQKSYEVASWEKGSQKGGIKGVEQQWGGGGRYESH